MLWDGFCLNIVDEDAMLKRINGWIVWRTDTWISGQGNYRNLHLTPRWNHLKLTMILCMNICMLYWTHPWTFPVNTELIYGLMKLLDTRCVWKKTTLCWEYDLNLELSLLNAIEGNSLYVRSVWSHNCIPLRAPPGTREIKSNILAQVGESFLVQSLSRRDSQQKWC